MLNLSEVVISYLYPLLKCRLAISKTMFVLCVYYAPRLLKLITSPRGHTAKPMDSLSTQSSLISVCHSLHHSYVPTGHLCIQIH